MTSALAERGTLAIVAADLEGPEGALRWVRVLAPLWGGRFALIVLRDDFDREAAEAIPAGSTVIGAGAEVTRALGDASDDRRAAATASALLTAATDKWPLARVLFVAGAEELPLLPAFSAAAFPCPVDLELLPSAGVPDEEQLWEHCDSLLIGDDSRLYQLSAGRPALPVRVVPHGLIEQTLPALRELPGLGGEPRISVVAPVRGCGDLVLRTAESVLARTPGLLEMILIDDASPDASLSKLEQLAGRDHRVRLLMHQDQRGFAASCNRGLAAARGDLVVGLNADTVVTPGWAGRLAEHLARQRNAGVVGPLSNRVTGLQQVAPVDYNESTLAGLTLFSDRLARSAQGRATPVVRLDSLCLAISRPALRRIGGFDPRFFPAGYEDDDFCLRVIAAGLAPYRADDTFIHHEAFKSRALEAKPHGEILEENWVRFKAKWGLPSDRPRERHYSVEELPLAFFARERHFIAPWKAVAPIRA